MLQSLELINSVETATFSTESVENGTEVRSSRIVSYKRNDSGFQRTVTARTVDVLLLGLPRL